MKTLMLLTVFNTAIFFTACGQINVPDAAKQTFQQKFPNAKSVKWEKEEGNYEAEFKIKDNQMSANFNEAGEWLETETEIKLKELPAAILEAIKTQFPGYKIEEADKIERANGEIAYEVEIEEGEQTLEVIFSADGKVINKKMEKEDEDEDRD